MVLQGNPRYQGNQGQLQGMSGYLTNQGHTINLQLVTQWWTSIAQGSTDTMVLQLAIGEDYKEFKGIQGALGIKDNPVAQGTQG